MQLHNFVFEDFLRTKRSQLAFPDQQWTQLQTAMDNLVSKGWVQTACNHDIRGTPAPAICYVHIMSVYSKLETYLSNVHAFLRESISLHRHVECATACTCYSLHAPG